MIVYELNFNLHVRTATWNVDLVLGRPGSPQPPDAVIRRGAPSTVEVAIEIKSVMTEHRKAVKNRKRDFEAHHEHVHQYNRMAIAGGVMVVNQSATFKSPLRLGITTHGRGDQRALQELTRHCVSEMRSVSERGDIDGVGLDAKCVIVVSVDNVNLAATRFEERPPAPQPGDPLHYDAFLQRLCAQYQERFQA